MNNANFISIIAGLIIFAIAMIGKLFHQKPSNYCQRLFDEHQERLEKIEFRLDGHDKNTGQHKTDIALLMQGSKNIEKTLDNYQKMLEDISEGITKILTKKER